MLRGIGLLGGSFDPVHTGHIALARAALQALHLQRVDFVLAPRPWQKSVATPVALRLQMLQAAARRHEGLGVCTKELERTGATYTIETVRALREDYGPSMPLVLLIGADQWENFHTWRCWRELFEYVHVAVCSREQQSGTPIDEVRDFAAGRFCESAALTQTPHGRYTTFDMPAHAASSTKIRSLFATLPREQAFKALDAWLPTEVARLIAQHNAY